MLRLEEQKRILESFNALLQEWIDALKPDVAAEKAAALELQSQEPSFWDDSAAAQKILQEMKRQKDITALARKMTNQHTSLLELCELAMLEEDESFVDDIERDTKLFGESLETVRLELLLSGEYDHCSAILSFHAGAGGTEAQDWNEMLVRMYMRWAERCKYKVKMLDSLDGEGAGLKSATLLIEGERAFGYLKSEMGIHRLVRISPFDSSGRRHTSFAAVEVMPDIENDTDVVIRDEDIRVETHRSSGAGGQKVNKTDSAVRIVHIPTGIVTACQSERSQHQNRDTCMRMLRAKLAEIKQQQHLEKIEDIKGVQKAIEWGSQIRSYVFMPYTLVKDHRTNHENGNIQAVMDGDLDGFIHAYLRHLVG